MSTKTIVPGKCDSEYRTSDIHMIQALMALCHRPVRIESEDGVIHYVFDNCKVEPDVNDLLTNGDKSVSIRMVWAASQVWAMNLHRARNLV